MNMKITAKEPLSYIDGGPIQTICPYCGHKGTFEAISRDRFIQNKYICGQRLCPDKDCQNHIFVVLDVSRNLLFYYPFRNISLNKENIPASIIKTFDEAVTCHAQNCFVASAIMIRRTLEEICEERGAVGKDLQTRIHNLQTKTLLPQELFDAMDELLLLGEDAAHIEADTFAQISTQELDVAIEFTTEFLKALYQYSSLLSKMRELKNNIPKQSELT
jgi:hypothetical protein